MLDQHLLGELSDADADLYLRRVPIPEEDIRTRIVGSAEGLPHYLDLAVSLYEDIRNAGETPKPGDFGTTPVEVRERFLDHVPPDERRELLLAAYPESLSERLFLDLADAVLGGAGNVNWARLGRRSFMTEGEGGRLVMHALMREALQNHDEVERAELFTGVHEWLFDRYAARARVPDAISVTREAERALLAACGHAARLGLLQLFKWIMEVHEPFHAAARWRVLEEVYTGAFARFPEPSSERAWLLHELARVRQAMGRHEAAEALYEQVLAIKKTVFGKAHPAYATTLHQLASVRQEMGRHEEAEALYEQALAILKTARGEAHPSYATTLHNLAHARQAMGRHEEAEALYKQALGGRGADRGVQRRGLAAAAARHPVRPSRLVRGSIGSARRWRTRCERTNAVCGHPKEALKNLGIGR